ncbi:hypothetical protein HK102_008436 [Quaeritorhiza haematococci]|nr:hypothetical protein HK102_008436 [Quaeritorhiza haematococci]
MEDFHSPSSDRHAPKSTYIDVNPNASDYNPQVFVVADGHGGSDAAQFFTEKATREVRELVGGREWNFSRTADRRVLEQEIKELFQAWDSEYCIRALTAYKTWLDNGSPDEHRPKEDTGCTLCVNIIHRGWLINCNVGDSRTIVGVKSAKARGLTTPKQTDALLQQQQRVSCVEDIKSWRLAFQSADHNMMNPAKVYSIRTKGGVFLTPHTTVKTIHVTTPEQRGFQPYHELCDCRLYRPPDERIKALGVNHRRTLNLTGTMGDLLFKIEPAILSPIPDVTFVALEETLDYAIVIATDGVWDHMDARVDHTQSQQVLARVGRYIDRAEEQRTGDEEEDLDDVPDGIFCDSDEEVESEDNSGESDPEDVAAGMMVVEKEWNSISVVEEGGIQEIGAAPFEDMVRSPLPLDKDDAEGTSKKSDVQLSHAPSAGDNRNIDEIHDETATSRTPSLTSSRSASTTSSISAQSSPSTSPTTAGTATSETTLNARVLSRLQALRRHEHLKRASRSLVRREWDTSGLFVPSQIRYDDATVFTLYLRSTLVE